MEPNKGNQEVIPCIMQIKNFHYDDYDFRDDWQDALNKFVAEVQLKGVPNSMLPTPNGIMVMYGIPEDEYLNAQGV